MQHEVFHVNVTDDAYICPHRNYSVVQYIKNIYICQIGCVTKLILSHFSSGLEERSQAAMFLIISSYHSNNGWSKKNNNLQIKKKEDT